MLVTRILSMTAMVAVVLVFSPAGAETRTAYYVANGVAAIGLNPEDPNPTNIPFTAFSADGNAPKEIEVIDLNGGPIGVSVCQNHNAEDANCGTGDAEFRFCVPDGGGPVKIPKNLGFTGDIATVVFIDASGVDTGCDGQGTVGTIALTT